MKFRSAQSCVVFAMIGAIVACAHAAQSNEAGNPLTGSRWQLQMLGPTAVLESAKPTLEFAPSDRVSGTGSCNQFNGSGNCQRQVDTFGPLASTKMACATRSTRRRRRTSKR